MPRRRPSLPPPPLLPCILLAFAAATTAPVYAFGAADPPPPPPRCRAHRRRDVLRVGAAAVLGSLVTVVVVPPGAVVVVNADVVRSPGRCANGVGDGCDALSDDNSYVKSLQSISRDNREANQREALNAYYMKNYPDVFALSDRKLVRRAKDGSYALYTPEEVRKLTNDGRIRMEYPRSKGGRIPDLTQRPVLVLVEE